MTRPRFLPRWIVHHPQHNGACAALILNAPANLPLASAYPDRVDEIRRAGRPGQVMLLESHGGAATDVRGLFRTICKMAHEQGVVYLYALIDPDDATAYRRYAVVMDWGVRQWDFADGADVIAVRYDVEALFSRYVQEGKDHG